MRRFFLISLFLFILPFQLVYLYSRHDNDSKNVAGIKTRESEEIVNWAAIGDYRFSLFGYTSPFAVVTFDGQGIHDETISDSRGYFEMANRFSPFSPREACLSSKDQFGRISSPVCLPPFPVKYTVSIGPVLIPPTISLDKDVYYIDDQVKLSGQTIPDSEVNLSVFTKSGPNLSLVRPVDAFSFPDLAAKSDKEGNFSLSLPSSNPQKFRLFAQTGFKNGESGESIKLNFEVYPVWMVIVRFFMFLIERLKGRLLEIIIALEIAYLVWFIYKSFLHPDNLSRAIILRPQEALTIKNEPEESIVVYHEPPVLAKGD